jgi:uncharacterized protein (TIGR00255 family)
MIKSMTGYGRGKYENENREYTVEIKSVNNRYSDISIKLPRNISYLEEKIKKEISSKVSRGKIDVFITFYNNSTKGKNIKFNNELVKMYVNELKQLAVENNIKDEIQITDISKFPDVLTIENTEDEELIWNELQIPLKEALNNFIEMRTIEGQKIHDDLLMRINDIQEKVNTISQNSTRLIKDYIVKLENRIKELLNTENIDENRLAMETVIYADKCSVEEEITRLNSHIFQFKNLIEGNVVGKKIDFLIQEMNRETNTIGSKSSSTDITNMVIEMKTQIEDIREQIQNIE